MGTAVSTDRSTRLRRKDLTYSRPKAAVTPSQSTMSAREIHPASRALRRPKVTGNRSRATRPLAPRCTNTSMKALALTRTPAGTGRKRSSRVA